MTGWARRVAAAVGAAATVIAGCESPLAPPATTTDVLTGHWTACVGAGAGDRSTTIAFYPDASYLLVTRTYATTDGTCGGAETGSSFEAWRYTLGNDVSAFFGPGGALVPAREMNSMSSLVTIYSIVYEDTHATPPRLYFGDLTLDPALDGTAATKRPEVLSSAALSAF